MSMLIGLINLFSTIILCRGNRVQITTYMLILIAYSAKYINN